jgi:hypothetical protein
MLVTILLLLTLGCVVILWLGAVFLQGWLYNDLASKLPLRAVVGGVIMALFLTGWCAIYKNDPGRFDTLINFSREKLDGTYEEIHSVRKIGEKEQKPVKFVRKPGGRGASDEFKSIENGKPWKRSDAEGMVIAVLVKENDKAEPTRFDAKLEPNGKFPTVGLRYVQANENRYMEEVALGQIYRVRSGAVIGNLFANALHLGLWILVLTFVLRFTPGHAVGIGLVLWGVMMIIVQPVLFGLVVKQGGFGP